MKGIFVFVLEFMLTLHKVQNSNSLMCTKFKIWAAEHFKSYSSFSYCAHSSVYRVFWPSSRVSKKINMYALNDPTTGPEHPIYRTMHTI